MNWGYRILLVIVLFISMILYFLYVSMQQTNELIDDHYYEKEKQFQGLLDASENLAALEGKLDLAQDAKWFSITLPPESISGFSQGTVDLLCLNDQSKDRHFALQPDSTGLFAIDKSRLFKGVYELRLKWTSDGKEYVFRDKVKISAP
ncbi:MAG TPA: FixH family protein [Saprospiraceae bacterium]|nr:FixH family protein [Saprospiraceae bacterium]